jgi:hypothetical protein
MFQIFFFKFVDLEELGFCPMKQKMMLYIRLEQQQHQQQKSYCLNI